jgi:Carboxypeptidase regulatory-like domain
MLRLRIPAVLFVLLCATYNSAQNVSPFSPPDNSVEPPKFRVSGVVVNSATGQPIRRALVALYSGQQRATMTDSDGRFEFEDIPQSNVAVAAQRPGFFGDQELSDGRRPPVQLEVGPETKPVTIRLTPEAAVFGRVVDTDGLPIQHLMLRTSTQRVQDGRRIWQQGMSASTDEDGRYRIFGLKPGGYILSAGPSQMPALVTTGGDPLELGYPEVTYPGGSASPMRLLAGQQMELNLTMRAEPFYTVSGSVGGGEEEQRLSVQLMSRSVSPQMQFSAQVDPVSYTFQFPRVARGSYTLSVWGADKSGKPITSSRPIQVSGNLMGVHLELQSVSTIPVRVRVERTREVQAEAAPNPRRTFVPVRLVSTEDYNRQFYSSLQDQKNPESPIVLDNVAPGTYRAVIDPPGGEFYVASARLGMTDLLTDDLTITENSSQGQIDIVLRDDAPTLQIKLRGPERKSDVQVVVVPDRGQPEIARDFPWTSNQQNSIPRRLRPGSYTVLVFDDVSDLEYTNREALEPYLSKGIRVTLSANEERTISPELIRRGEE